MPLNFKMFLFCLLVAINNISATDSGSYAIKSETTCEDRMNLKYGPTKDWKCSLFDNPTHVTHLKTLNSISRSKRSLKCMCTYHYECLDTEEFTLDSELVNVNEYMKKDYCLQKNFYTELCEEGLHTLTNETDWNCMLMYDRFHLDEYYCNCVRAHMCRIDKLLEIKS